MRGTWLHEQMSYATGLLLEGETTAYWTEEVAPEKCVYEGELFGCKIGCKVDCLKRDYSQLVDFKFRKPGAIRHLERGQDGVFASGEADAAQLNMNRMLIEQTIGRELPEMEMVVWVESDGWHRTVAPRMTMLEISEVKPGGGEFTIRQNLQLTKWAMDRWGEEKDPEILKKIIGDIPLVGSSMYKTRKGLTMCTAFCEVQRKCFDIEGGV
jgi:hypothetical protein